MPDVAAGEVGHAGGDTRRSGSRRHRQLRSRDDADRLRAIQTTVIAMQALPNRLITSARRAQPTLCDQSVSRRSEYGSRVAALARPRLTMYATATQAMYFQPSLAPRSASAT
jgi:hypothetical protein